MGDQTGALPPLQAVWYYQTQLALLIPSEFVGLGNTQVGHTGGKVRRNWWRHQWNLATAWKTEATVVQVLAKHFSPKTFTKNLSNLHEPDDQQHRRQLADCLENPSL